ncbi:MAG: hypothetical protein CMH56_16625 [Myxococcales bacterium]|nr:hypothetical protein [Myxococcales bacterium]
MAQFRRTILGALLGALPLCFCAESGLAKLNNAPVFQSVSWQLPNEAFLSVALHPLQAETALVGGETGIYRTTDGGRTWERVLFLGAKQPQNNAFIQQVQGVTPPPAEQNSWFDEDIIEEFDDLLGNVAQESIDEQMPAGDFQDTPAPAPMQGSLQTPLLNPLQPSLLTVTIEPRLDGVFQLVWPSQAPNLVLAATHFGLYFSQNGGLSFERMDLGGAADSPAYSVALVSADPLRVVVAQLTQMVFFDGEEERLREIQGGLPGVQFQMVTPLDGMKRGWAKSATDLYEIDGYRMRRRLVLTQSNALAMGQDPGGNAMVADGNILHLIPRNAQAQHREYLWPFETIERIDYANGCGDGWLFITTEGWIWVDTDDLGVFKKIKKGRDQISELLCVEENKVSHVWAVGPYGVYRELSATKQAGMSPERLMARWQQEPTLSQVGAWGLAASHKSFDLPMQHLDRAHTAAYLPELIVNVSWGFDGQERAVVDLLPEQKSDLEDLGFDTEDLMLSPVQNSLGLDENNPWGRGREFRAFAWLRWRFEEVSFWTTSWQQVIRLQPSVFAARQKRLRKLKELYEQRRTAQISTLRRARDPLEAELWVLRVEELSAQIDGLTGGAYMRALQEMK